MVQSVRGQFRDQVAHPDVPVERRDGQGVIITFLPPDERAAVLQAVHGRFRDGLAKPSATVEGHEGEPVMITFLEERLNPPDLTPEEYEAEWEALEQLVDSCQMDTGIPDLAHQHDHYIHGTPKKEDPYLNDAPKKEGSHS